MRLHALVLMTSLALAAPAHSQPPHVQARADFNEAMRAYEAGDFARAAAHFEEAYRVTREPSVAFNAGRALERMSEFDGAIRYYRIYLAANPTAANRAEVRQRIEALRDAKARMLRAVFVRSPETSEMTAESRRFFEHGVLLFRRRSYRAALEAFTAAYRFAPLPEVIFNIAVTAERLGQNSDAADYYREYLRARPEAPERAALERKIARLRN